jgi:hypothetical protein
MTRQLILDRLKAESRALRLKYGLKSLGISGSVASGAANRGCFLLIRASQRRWQAGDAA